MSQAIPYENIELLRATKLAPYARNSRTHSEDQVRQIAASIEEFGFTNPVLVDQAGGIIAGHGRVLAAQLIGMKEVPCIRLSHLTEAQKRAYVIADNKLALNAGWDEELLALELGELREEGFDLELTGFGEDELAALLADGSGGLTDPDEAPEPEEAAITRKGDTWLLGKHRLRCGDSTSAEDVAALLGDAKPHLMVTDPPYGVNYDPSWRARAGTNSNKDKQGKVHNDDRADWREAWALFPGDVAYVWHGGLHAGEVEKSLQACGFEVRAQIIWSKDRMALSRGHYHWKHEPCWYVVRMGGASHWQGGRDQNTVWTIPARDDSGHGHGTQKPVECMRRPILNNSSRGQAVYEPFCGSGTTIIAGQMEGRPVYAMELDERYCDVSVRRWEAFTGDKAVLEDGGATFEDAAADRVAAAA